MAIELNLIAMVVTKAENPKAMVTYPIGQIAKADTTRHTQSPKLQYSLHSLIVHAPNHKMSFISSPSQSKDNVVNPDKVKMKMLNLPLLASLTVFLVSVHGGNPNPVPAPPPSPANEFLEAHNEARAAVGVEPLQWSEKLSKDTSLLVRYQRNKNGCQFANLTTSKYGGNQLWAGSGAVTPSMAVEEWVKEKDFYIHGNNSCVGKHGCGVYTQVVWKKSLQLGCSQATCVKEKASLTICFYDPPGNVIGESPY